MQLKLKIPPVVVFLLCAGLMLAAQRALPVLDIAFPLQDLVAVALVLAGCWLGFSGVYTFRQSSTTVNPHRPQNTTALVTQGVYQHSRNPMYLGLLLWLTGWGLYLANLASLLLPVVFVAYMTRYQIKPEEDQLEQRFGQQFQAYKARVRRWL